MYFNVFPNSFKCIVLEVRNKTSIYMYVPDSSEVLGFLGVPWDTILVIRVLPWRPDVDFHRFGAPRNGARAVT